MSNYPLLTVLRDDEQPEDYDPCDGCKGFCELCPVWPYVKPKEEPPFNGEPSFKEQNK